MTRFVHNHMIIPKSFAALLSGIAAYFSSMPSEVHQASTVAAYFIAFDFVFGLIAARAQKRVNSRAMRKQMCVKLATYFGIVGFAFGLDMFSQNFRLLLWAWVAVSACEGLSIAEKLRILFDAGGPTLKPAARFLEKLLGLLPDPFRDVGEEEEEQKAAPPPQASASPEAG